MPRGRARDDAHTLIAEFIANAHAIFVEALRFTALWEVRDFES
jgi:hypothetical protein